MRGSDSRVAVFQQEQAHPACCLSREGWSNRSSRAAGRIVGGILPLLVLTWFAVLPGCGGKRISLERLQEIEAALNEEHAEKAKENLSCPSRPTTEPPSSSPNAARLPAKLAGRKETVYLDNVEYLSHI